MVRKLNFDEMYSLAEKVDLWSERVSDINDLIDPRLADYVGYAGEIFIKITTNPSISAFYHGIKIGEVYAWKEHDLGNKLERLRHRIYQSFEKQDGKMVDSFTKKGVTLARKLLNPS